MKIIKTNRSKKKKVNKFNIYWRKVFPKGYVDILSYRDILLKVSSDLREESISGKICITDDDFVYVDVPDDMVNIFFDLLKKDHDKIEKPPCMSENDVGAHISVIKSEEKLTRKFDDEGASVSYEIIGLSSVVPDGWEEMSRVWMLTIQSNDLEKLREKYGLSKKIDDHEFHITFAVKRKK